MPKNLDYWENVLRDACRAKEKAERQLDSKYFPGVHPPSRWRKVNGRWFTISRRHYLRMWIRWMRYRRLAVRAARERAKADRRIAYARVRIDAIRQRTAWARLGKIIE